MPTCSASKTRRILSTAMSLSTTTFMTNASLHHEFVDSVPDTLQFGVLYVSIRFATAVHLCPCGCGYEVVTPFSPTDWRLTFDGKTISLDPSIGNWSFPCQSHYWIRKNRVQWARKWSKDEIAAGRARDERLLAQEQNDPTVATPADRIQPRRLLSAI